MRTRPACSALILASIFCGGQECRGSATVGTDVQGSVVPHLRESPESPQPKALNPKPQSAWLKYVGKPPENGALGWITNVHHPIWVEWAKDGQIEKTTGDKLIQYKYTNGAMFDRGPDIGVFDLTDGIPLVYGAKGWCWILPGQEDDVRLCPQGMCPIAMTVETAYLLSKAATLPNKDGYVFVLGELMGLVRPMDVHERPDLTSRKAGALPKEWPRRKAIWILPWSDWQHLAQAGPLPPLSNLKFFKTDRKATSLPPKLSGPTLLKVHEIEGDWARVSGPEPGTTIIEVDNDESAPIENPGYLIHWTAKPLGWIRWRVPGPVPGTKLCAVELNWSGVVD